MGAYKLSDVLKQKKTGDEWWSVLAPEPYRFWTYEHQWSPEKFDSLGLGFLFAAVSGESVEKKTHLIKYRARTPYFTSNGKEIKKGLVRNIVKTIASFTIEANNIFDFNETMYSISNERKIFIWEIKRLVLWNADMSAEADFRKHNPDGTGVDMFLFKMRQDKKETLYPDIALNTQERLCKKFKEKTAWCYCKEVKEKTHGCLIKDGKIKMVRKKGIRSHYPVKDGLQQIPAGS